ncbi:MAG: DNA polymerase III subunit delta' [Planctomycetota bacterium]
MIATSGGDALCPQILGHEPVRAAFTRALERHRVAHAYLFTGPSGVGKRAFAEGLAAAILCPRTPVGACGDCPSCTTFRSGNHPGYSLVAPRDGAISIEIAQIRETIEALSVRTGERRVLIVDPADAMPPASANAFLKTLEEPPAGIVFLLVTSEPSQLLDTIHSRCHRVGFTGLEPETFARVLADHEVAAGEASLLYPLSSGSPGLALRLREGIEACGGADVFADLLDGRGLERPDALLELVPALRSDEPKRDRVRRLLELVIDGLRGRRPVDDPDLRERVAARAFEVAKLYRGLDVNLNAELVLERLARCLRAGR